MRALLVKALQKCKAGGDKSLLANVLNNASLPEEQAVDDCVTFTVKGYSLVSGKSAENSAFHELILLTWQLQLLIIIRISLLCRDVLGRQGQSEAHSHIDCGCFPHF